MSPTAAWPKLTGVDSHQFVQLPVLLVVAVHSSMNLFSWFLVYFLQLVRRMCLLFSGLSADVKVVAGSSTLPLHVWAQHEHRRPVALERTWLPL